MTAKDELLGRLEHLSAAKELPVLIDVGIVQSTHNGVANLLRKGLGIVAFNILEDFIKKRSSEALSRVSASRISFSKLPVKLQEAAILEAVSSLAFRAKLEKKEGGDWRTLIQAESLKIHSTGKAVFELSDFSLASSGSNVTAEEVNQILSAFGVSGGWAILKKVSDSIGGGLPDLSQSYKNAASRRHSCAHEANFNYDYLWLGAIKSEILAIAASLDIVLEARCRQVEDNLNCNMQDHRIDDALSYRFLHEDSGVYKESKVLGGRSIKNWPNLSDALVALRPKLRRSGEFLIILDNTKRISDWYVS
ncbi:hypothetical protein GHU06_00590 [Pseudomonas aeruginosa]|uniref:HEPN domain-containing protein n=1 Tax=Pseudomonas aeruginosa TaxID=287 RepID=UPI001A316B22|nr:HEPN domain-containing protein [Pseudomonas aeruginosa]MBG7423246.1 hypothetical protein [Pseudomonas aeruginosa]MDI4099065.1 HEPN domain-containing protein [Pseudomonas aeruginosa]HBO5139327.1 hypothetical protein [Pseudomonas aeruginosa]HCF7386388.1 hypothetical protein [Pseudomonas aeruginosa]HEP8172275.1 hypothetical protein [Pseudomonas aeruginosa]